MRTGFSTIKPEERASTPHGPLDHALFQRMGWMLQPLHAKIMRIIAQSGGGRGFTYLDIRDRYDKQVSSKDVWLRCTQLKQAGLVEVYYEPSEKRKSCGRIRRVRLTLAGWEVLPAEEHRTSKS